MFKKTCLWTALLSLACLLMVADFADAGRRRGRGGRGGCGGCGGGYDGGCYGAYGSSEHGYHHAYGSNYQYDGATDQRDSYYLAPSVQSQLPANSAMIRVLVRDPQTRIWFDGAATQQTGTMRVYHTPSLSATAPNSYRVRATWTEGGREVIQERVVTVSSGKTVVVDFNRAEGERLPEQLPEGAVPSATQLEGKIIRTGTNQFVIETRDSKQVTVYTNPQTRYTLNQKSAAFTDLSVGTSVNLGFTVQGDRHIANTITIAPR